MAFIVKPNEVANRVKNGGRIVVANLDILVNVKKVTFTLICGYVISLWCLHVLKEASL